MELGVSDTTDLVQLSDVEDADLAALGMNKVEIGRMRRMLAEAAAAPPASMYVQGDDGLSAGMMDGLPLQQMGSPTDSWTGQQPSGAGLAPVAAHPINIQRVKHMCSGGQMLTGCAVLMNIVLSIVILNSQGNGTSCDKAPEHDRLCTVRPWLYGRCVGDCGRLPWSGLWGTSPAAQPRLTNYVQQHISHPSNLDPSYTQTHAHVDLVDHAGGERRHHPI